MVFTMIQNVADVADGAYADEIGKVHSIPRHGLARLLAVDLDENGHATLTFEAVPDGQVPDS